jgi:DNA-binding HxlR family transcriptional regulator
LDAADHAECDPRHDPVRGLPGRPRITDNVLSIRPARLVDARLLNRVPYRNDAGRTRHEYRLTQAGADVTPILRALAHWGAQHSEPAEPTEPTQFLHQDCGHRLTSPEAYCEHCRRPAQREDQLWPIP